MQARCSRVASVLLGVMWRLVRLTRAIVRFAGRVKVLPLPVQRWKNGTTVGVVVLIQRAPRSDPKNGKETTNEDR